MFGQKARLRDLGHAEELNPVCTHDWLKQHQDDLKAIYVHAQDQLTAAADRQNQVTSPVSQPLAPGTLVYKVQRALDQDGRVHTICPLNGIGPEN